MAAPGGPKVKATGPELNQLIAEVGAWLRGGGDSSMDGSGATQADAHAAQFVAKLRAILPRLLDALLDPERGACARAPRLTAYSSLFARSQALTPPFLQCVSAAARS